MRRGLLPPWALETSCQVPEDVVHGGGDLFRRRVGQLAVQGQQLVLEKGPVDAHELVRGHEEGNYGNGQSDQEELVEDPDPWTGALFS